MPVTAEGLAHLQTELLKARTEALQLKRLLEDQRDVVAKLTDEAEALHVYDPAKVRELLAAIDEHTGTLALSAKFVRLWDAAKALRENEGK
jgi:Mg2+ and Co2+ transporter CorA